MKKYLIIFTVNVMIIYGLLTVFAQSIAKASEYNTAVIGHVITQKVSGQPIDTSKLMEQEMARIAHLYAIDMISIFQKYLPSILDKAAADLRAEADKQYKCSLIEGTKVACK
jgi:hypothetical protein